MKFYLEKNTYIQANLQPYIQLRNLAHLVGSLDRPSYLIIIILQQYQMHTGQTDNLLFVKSFKNAMFVAKIPCSFTMRVMVKTTCFPCRFQCGSGGLGVRVRGVGGRSGAGGAAARAADRVDGAARLPMAGAGQGREAGHGRFTGGTIDAECSYIYGWVGHIYIYSSDSILVTATTASKELSIKNVETYLIILTHSRTHIRELKANWANQNINSSFTVSKICKVT